MHQDLVLGIQDECIANISIQTDGLIDQVLEPQEIHGEDGLGGPGSEVAGDQKTPTLILFQQCFAEYPAGNEIDASAKENQQGNQSDSDFASKSQFHVVLPEALIGQEVMLSISSKVAHTIKVVVCCGDDPNDIRRFKNLCVLLVTIVKPAEGSLDG